MQVVYLTQIPYHRRLHDLYVAPLLKRGEEVRVIDGTPCLRPPSHKAVRLPDEMEYERWESHATREALVDAVKNVESGSLLFPLVYLSRDSVFLYRAIKASGLPFCGHLPMTIPYPDLLERPRGLAGRLAGLRKRYGSANKVFQTLSRSFRVPSEKLGLPSASLLLLNSRSLPEIQFPVGPDTRLVRLHSMDFDNFMAWKKAPSEPVLKPSARWRAVFLENASPSDQHKLLIGKVRTPITDEVYYPEIIGFLRRMVQEHDLDLTVAAHPKALWENRLEHYAEFDIVQGKSMQAVSEADVVFAHCTLSVGYAVMLGKPVVFLTTDQLNLGKLGRFTTAQAEALGKAPVNISHARDVDLEREMVVDRERYDRYIGDYIVAGGDERPFWDQALEAMAQAVQTDR